MMHHVEVPYEYTSTTGTLPKDVPYPSRQDTQIGNQLSLTSIFTLTPHRVFPVNQILLTFRTLVSSTKLLPSTNYPSIP